MLSANYVALKIVVSNWLYYVTFTSRIIHFNVKVFLLDYFEEEFGSCFPFPTDDELRLIA